jgi:hypothetical protein
VVNTKQERKMAQRDKLYDVKYEEMKHQTAKAWLLDIGGKDYWLAKSLCDLNEDDKIVTMPEWLAVEKGLDNEVSK